MPYQGFCSGSACLVESPEVVDDGFDNSIIPSPQPAITNPKRQRRSRKSSRWSPAFRRFFGQSRPAKAGTPTGRWPTTTVSKAAKEDPELAALIQRAEDIAAGDPFLCLIAASRKSWRAALSLIRHRQKFREPPLVVDKEEQLREWVEDKRLELEYKYQSEVLEDQARDREAARQEAKKDAAEAAWQERERLMLAKERAERAERKKRRLEREAARQGDESSDQ